MQYLQFHVSNGLSQKVLKSYSLPVMTHPIPQHGALSLHFGETNQPQKFYNLKLILGVTYKATQFKGN